MRLGMRLRIGELAALCGVSTRTVDYYTRMGLLHPSTRTDGNYRLYEPGAVTRLRHVKQLQAERLSLGEIRQRLTEEGLPPELSTLTDVVRDLEAINRKLATVGAALGKEPAADRAVSEATSEALASAMAITAYLQQISRQTDRIVS